MIYHDITMAKREKRTGERRWLKSKRPEPYLDFIAHRNIFNIQMNRAKATYYREKITSSQRDIQNFSRSIKPSLVVGSNACSLNTIVVSNLLTTLLTSLMKSPLNTPAA